MGHASSVNLRTSQDSIEVENTFYLNLPKRDYTYKYKPNHINLKPRKWPWNSPIYN